MTFKMKNGRWFNEYGMCILLVLSYAKNIGIRRAISSGNPETYKKLDMIWQSQIKDGLKSYLDLF